MIQALRIVSLLLVSLTVIAHAQQSLPQDVARFVERRDLCDHFRGEEPYDAERREFLAKRMRELCTGTDADLVSLKKKYKSTPEVIVKLSTYESKIEAP
jgi:hypothetical protein